MSFEPTDEQKERIALAKEIVEQAIREGSEYRSAEFVERCTSEHGVNIMADRERDLET